MLAFNLDNPRSALTADVTPFVSFPTLGIFFQSLIQLSFPKVGGLLMTYMTSGIKRDGIEYVGPPLQKFPTVNTL